MNTAAQKRSTDFAASVADYMDLPGSHRGELVDGEITSMPPATPVHGRLQAQLAALLHAHLRRKGGPCWVATEPGVQARLQANINVRIPDLGVCCKPETPDDRFLRDPLLLVEIFSPGNGKDTASNAMAYATIETVREILIVNSTRRALQFGRRGADCSWPLFLTSIGEDGSVELASIGLTLTVAEIYAGTSLDAAAAG